MNRNYKRQLQLVLLCTYCCCCCSLVCFLFLSHCGDQQHMVVSLCKYNICFQEYRNKEKIPINSPVSFSLVCASVYVCFFLFLYFQPFGLIEYQRNKLELLRHKRQTKAIKQNTKSERIKKYFALKTNGLLLQMDIFFILYYSSY